MKNNKYSLQILHHDEVLASREDAKTFVLENLVSRTLMGEPAVVFYNNGKSTPSAMLAIGAGNSKTYVYDIDEILEKVEAISLESDEQATEISETVDFVKDVIKACGLTETFNDEGKTYVYAPDPKDDVIGETKTIAEAIATLSEYVQEFFTNTDLTVKETDTVVLKYKDAKDGGKVLKADVKVSEHGKTDNKSFNDNILSVKSDGLYVAVDLEYDEKAQTLTFSTSKADMDDVIKKEINLGIGEHVDVEAKNDATKPVKVAVSKDGDMRYVSADVELASGDNNIAVKDGKLYVKPVGPEDMKVSSVANNIVKLFADGLFANVDITYDVATNSLTFTNGVETKVIKLNSASIVKGAYYDSDNDKIVINFSTTDGKDTVVEIPVGSLIDEWDVDNTGHSVTLTKTHNHPNGDKLSADVNVSGDVNNILQNINGLLTVRGVSDNIKHKTGTVASELDSLNAEIANEISERANAINDVLNKLEKESDAREKADDKLEHMIEDLDIATLKKTVTEFKNLYDEFQTEWEKDKVLIDKAIADAESVAGRVEKLEKDLTALTNRVSIAEKDIDKNETAIAKNTEDILKLTSDLVAEANTARTAETKNENAISAEADRAKLAEEGLKTSLDDLKKVVETNTTNIAANKDAVSTETNRATAAETQLTNDLNTESTRAKTEESRIDGVVKTNSASIAANAAEIEKIKAEDAKLNTDLTAEKNRAMQAEQALDGKISANTTAIEGLKSEVNGKVGSVKLNKSESGLEYDLTVDGNSIGKIVIPEDQFLNQVEYDDVSKILTFTFTGGQKPVNINIHDLVDVYTAGKGLVLNGNEFSVTLSTDEETSKYLVMTDDANAKIKLQGITTAINTAKSEAIAATTYTAGDGLTLVDNKFNGKVYENETYLKVGENGFYTKGIDDAISTAVGAAKTEMDEKFANVSKDLGNAKSDLEGKINAAIATAAADATTKADKALADAKEYTDGKVDDFKATTQTNINDIKTSITQLNGDLTNLKTEVNNLKTTESTHYSELSNKISTLENVINGPTGLAQLVKNLSDKYDEMDKEISYIKGQLSTLLDAGTYPSN